MNNSQSIYWYLLCAGYCAIVINKPWLHEIIDSAPWSYLELALLFLSLGSALTLTKRLLSIRLNRWHIVTHYQPLGGELFITPVKLYFGKKGIATENGSVIFPYPRIQGKKSLIAHYQLVSVTGDNDLTLNGISAPSKKGVYLFYTETGLCEILHAIPKP